MNIAVITPHCSKSGNTLISALISLELASRGSKVCITHSLPKSESLYRYFGLSSVVDKTVKPERLVKMLTEGALKADDVGDYCRSINSRLEMFSADSDSFTQEDMILALECITQSFPHEYIVYDVDSNNLDSRPNRIILSNCDVAVIVVNQDYIDLNKFKSDRERIVESIGKIPQLVVVNKYCDVLGTVKETANMMGIKAPKNWSRVRYNPWLGYGTNFGELLSIHQNMTKSDYRVVDVASDIKALVNLILKVKVAKRQMNKDAVKRTVANKKTSGGDE